MFAAHTHTPSAPIHIPVVGALRVVLWDGKASGGGLRRHRRRRPAVQAVQEVTCQDGATCHVRLDHLRPCGGTQGGKALVTREKVVLVHRGGLRLAGARNPQRELSFLQASALENACSRSPQVAGCAVSIGSNFLKVRMGMAGMTATCVAALSGRLAVHLLLRHALRVLLSMHVLHPASRLSRGGG